MKVTIYKGTIPAWVQHISYRPSKTGNSMVVDVVGNMDKRSAMPGGTKRIYVNMRQWKRDTVEHNINNIMHGCRAVCQRWIGSCLVHEARSLLPANKLAELGGKLRSLGLNEYRDIEAERIIRNALNQARTER